MNNIIRSVILPSDPDTVWEQSFGSASALASWFPKNIEGNYALGGICEFIWGEHRSEVRIVEMDPGKKLSYQWHPGDAYRLDSFPESELTTVVFELEPCAEGTKVTVTEGDFDKIPLDRRDWAFKQNDEGWVEEIAKLPASYAS